MVNFMTNTFGRFSINLLNLREIIPKLHKYCLLWRFSIFTKLSFSHYVPLSKPRSKWAIQLVTPRCQHDLVSNCFVPDISSCVLSAVQKYSILQVSRTPCPSAVVPGEIFPISCTFQSVRAPFTTNLGAQVREHTLPLSFNLLYTSCSPNESLP